MEWKHPILQVEKKFKAQPSAGLVMVTLSWATQGPNLDHHHERSTAVNSVHYNGMLED
jgi:hypothetical protein